MRKKRIPSASIIIIVIEADFVHFVQFSESQLWMFTLLAVLEMIENVRIRLTLLQLRSYA